MSIQAIARPPEPSSSSDELKVFVYASATVSSNIPPICSRRNSRYGQLSVSSMEVLAKSTNSIQSGNGDVPASSDIFFKDMDSAPCSPRPNRRNRTSTSSISSLVPTYSRTNCSADDTGAAPFRSRSSSSQDAIASSESVYRSTRRQSRNSTNDLQKRVIKRMATNSSAYSSKGASPDMSPLASPTISKPNVSQNEIDSLKGLLGSSRMLTSEPEVSEVPDEEQQQAKENVFPYPASSSDHYNHQVPRNSVDPGGRPSLVRSNSQQRRIQLMELAIAADLKSEQRLADGPDEEHVAHGEVDENDISETVRESLISKVKVFFKGVRKPSIKERSPQ